MNEVTLKRALVIYLNEKGEEFHELNKNSVDEEFVDVIVNQLSEGNICPFKNYDCVSFCDDKCGDDKFDVDCGKESEAAWKDFISKNETY